MSSYIMKTHATDKGGQKMLMQIRNSLDRKIDRLSFNKYRLGLFAFVAVTSVAIIVMKSNHDSILRSAYDYEAKVNQLGNILRATSIEYKESVKSLLERRYIIDTSKYENKTFLNWQFLNHMVGRLKTNFNILQWVSIKEDVIWRQDGLSPPSDQFPTTSQSLFTTSHNIIQTMFDIWRVSRPVQNPNNVLTYDMYEFLRVISYEAHILMTEYFQNEIDNIDSNMQVIISFVVLNLLVILTMTAGCLVLALLTLLVLEKELRQMSDCLVRLDKAEIFKCIAVLKRNSRFIAMEMVKSDDISKKPTHISN